MQPLPKKIIFVFLIIREGEGEERRGERAMKGEFSFHKIYYLYVARLSINILADRLHILVLH